MAAIARKGDQSSHGGTIISGSSNTLTNGLPTAREGDMHSCPRHPPSALTPITKTTKVNGRLVITVGATAGCGAVIISGSPDAKAE